MNTASLVAAAKKQPIGFGCGAFCLICAILLFYRSDETANAQERYDAKAAEAAKIVANVRNSAGLAEQVAEIQAHTKEMEGRLVRAGQLAVNLQYFYKLEAENEVKLGEIHQNNIPPGKSGKTIYAGIPYSVSVQGGYKQLLVFLNRLESGRHFCRFNNVSFSKNAGGSGPADAMNLTLSIELLGTP